MRVQFQLEGAEALAAQLMQLGTKVERKVARPAVRSGQKVLLSAARQTAASIGRGTGRLYVRGRNDVSMSQLIAANLVIAVPSRQARGSYSLHVQLRRGVPEFVHVGKKGKRSYIPAAIEHGHGASPATSARPFMRPAAIRTVQERMRVLGQELASGILREAIVSRNK